LFANAVGISDTINTTKGGGDYITVSKHLLPVSLMSTAFLLTAK